LLLPQIWRGITFDHCMNLPELAVADLAAQRERLDELARQQPCARMPQRRKSSKSGRTNYGSDRPLSSTSARNVNRCRRTGGTAG